MSADIHTNKSDQGAVVAGTAYVTVFVGDQMFGLPILDVQDVFRPKAITHVPMAPATVCGVLNLRGRIVTAINMRAALGIADAADGLPVMAAGVEQGGEIFGLMVDRVGDVLTLSLDAFEDNPANLDPRWRSVSRGVFRLKDQLMIILNVAEVLRLQQTTPARTTG